MVFIAVTCRLRSSLPPPALALTLHFSLYLSFRSLVPWLALRLADVPQPGKMRNDRARSDSARALFKIQERFYCYYLPYRRASHKSAESRRGGEVGGISRERKCGPHFRTVRVQRKKERERDREQVVDGVVGSTHPTKYINCRIFRANCISVRARFVPCQPRIS